MRVNRRRSVKKQTQQTRRTEFPRLQLRLRQEEQELQRFLAQKLLLLPSLRLRQEVQELQLLVAKKLLLLPSLAKEIESLLMEAQQRWKARAQLLWTTLRQSFAAPNVGKLQRRVAHVSESGLRAKCATAMFTHLAFPSADDRSTVETLYFVQRAH